nr:MAG TPA: hypothetical protein [Bacteriophage sp.]
MGAGATLQSRVPRDSSPCTGEPRCGVGWGTDCHGSCGASQ